MQKRHKQWESLTLRPNFTGDWKTMEQRQNSRYAETTYRTMGKKHHLGEMEGFWIVFCEFNPEHWANEGLKYRYTVRGGRGVKPGEEVKYFKNIKEATDYVIFLSESTNAYLKEVISEETIQKYNKRIAEIKRMTEK